MKQTPHSGGSVYFDLAALRAEHRSLTRWQLFKTVFSRSAWPWRLALSLSGISLLVTPITLEVLFGAPGIRGHWFGGAMGASITVLIAILNLAAHAALKDRLPPDARRCLPLELHLRTLRYLFFRERVEQVIRSSSDHFTALCSIDQQERDLDEFALTRHPIYILLLFAVLTLISSATGHFPIWTNGVGIFLAIAIGFLFLIWMLSRRFIAALFLIPSYRKREFSLFLKLLAADATPTK